MLRHPDVVAKLGFEMLLGVASVLVVSRSGDGWNVSPASAVDRGTQDVRLLVRWKVFECRRSGATGETTEETATPGKVQ